MDKRLWPDIAKDIVLATLSGGGGLSQSVSYDDVISHYGLSVEDIRFLTRNEAFRKLVKAERARADALGDKASYVFKAEQMAVALGELLFRRLTDPNEDVSLFELRMGYESMARAAGLDQLPDVRVSGKGQATNAVGGVNIQINIPELPNGKLAHVRRERLADETQD
jgi:hypothetical protein